MTNQLFYGDNLEVLRRHIRDESIDLCYIDPPFNSKRNYNQIYLNKGKEDQAQAQAFIDTWTWDDLANQGLAEIQENYQGRFTSQSIDLISGLIKVLGKGSLLAYLISMTLRITEIHRVLKPTGSFYLHCDKTTSHYLKIITDAIFIYQGGDYRNEITWKRTSSHSDAKRYAKVNDVIFYYSKSMKFTWNPQRLSYKENYLNRYYSNTDENGRRYTYDNLTKPKGSVGYFYELLGCKPPANGWRMPESRAKEWIEEGRIQVTPTGKTPRYKRYADEIEGVVCSDNWTDIPPINSQAREALGYPTQKPEELMERIILASSNEGDVILDAYCGCGTSVIVSQRLGRQWIGVDITYQSIGLILKRLEDAFGLAILENIILNGIPKDVESAKALALKKDDRTRKEFEKWAVLTYSNNRATVNQKKGSDRGIDGIAYFKKNADDNEKVILQVKSGNVKSGDIRDLLGTITAEGAALGILITLKTPTKDMVKAAKEAGIYQSIYRSEAIDKIQIVTIQEIIEGKKRLDVPLVEEVLKSAEKQALSRQIPLDLE